MESSSPTDQISSLNSSPAHLAESDAAIQKTQKHLDASVQYLLGQQFPQGYWCGELEGDSILQSEYILLKWIIEQENDPRLPWITNYLRSQQRAEDGAWAQYPGAKPDISATVKGYFCLKLMGDPIDAPHMVKARELIHKMGGAEKCNSFSKFYLAALGQISYEGIPSIPPEIVFLPKWFYFNLDKVSAWTRTMITPLSIVTSSKFTRRKPLTKEQGIDELYLDQKLRHKLVAPDHAHRTWSKVFLSLDRIMKLVEKTGITPLRQRALQQVEKWIVDRTERSDGLGAIFPPMVYILIALRCRGYADDHPVIVEAAKHLDDLMIQDHAKEQIRFQPCHSPVWDTGIAAYALTEAGLNQESELLRKCAKWLVSKEVRVAADWTGNQRYEVEPSGWFFEFNNAFYPDVDDTAMVSMALRQIGGKEAIEASRRGVDQVLALQNDDGGWAAFDRTVDRPLLEHVPFADHNAIQDPSCPDITGRTLECMGYHGYTVTHPSVQQAIHFIRTRQYPDGSWFGRWGINYVYGTWQVLCGIVNVAQDMKADWVLKSGEWLRSVQKPDGSFGESADTYEDESLKGQGPSTASQTAWGTMGLMAIYGPNDPAVVKGIRWLCDTQLENGTWDEPWFTGTGFPKVFYLRYHLYKHYFPVMCIGRWIKLQRKAGQPPATAATN